MTWETRRTRIRSYSPTHFLDCAKLYGDRYTTLYFDHGIPRTHEEVRRLLKDGTSYFLEGRPFGLFSVFDKSEAGSFIGQIDLLPQECHGVVEIGCILRPEYQGLGLGTELLSSFIRCVVPEINRLGTSDVGLPIWRIVATAHPNNLACNRVLQKIGMQFDALGTRFNQPRIWYYYDFVS